MLDPFAVNAASIPPPSRGILARIKEFFAWPGPEAAQGREAARYVEREKIRSGPQDIKLPWFLPYEDDTGTGETQAMRLAYRKMYSDPVITAALNSQIFGIASLPLQIHPADKKNKHDVEVAEFNRWNLMRRFDGGGSGLIWKILSGACVDGYSVNEKVIDYQRKGKYAGKDVLTKLKQKDVGSDLVLNTDQYRNIVSLTGLRYNSGTEWDTSAFVIYSRLKMYERPTGLSALRCVYYHYWLRDTAWKLRQIGLTTKAFPVLVGTYETESVQPSLNESLRKAKSLSYLTIPKTCMVAALEIAGQSENEFEQSIRSLNEEIYLGITTATLQSLTGGKDVARGSSDVHKDSANANKGFIASEICGIFNNQDDGLLKDLTDLNFMAGDYPYASLAEVDPDAMNAKVTVATGIKALGLDQSKTALREELACEEPHEDDPDDCLAGTSAPDPNAKPFAAANPFGSPHPDDKTKQLGNDDLAAAGTEEPAPRPFPASAKGATGYSERWGSYVQRVGS